jgi:phosphatidylglycerophosphate synthase
MPRWKWLAHSPKSPLSVTVPNILTILRLLLAPPLFCLIGGGYLLWGLALYALGLVTDLLDGWIARATQATSAFGRSMDSTADKSLVAAGLLGLAQSLSSVPWVGIAFAFLYREIIVFGLRGIHLPQGIPVAKIKDSFGRARFLLLHLGLIVILLGGSHPSLQPYGSYIVIAAVLLAYVTLGYYISRDRETLRLALRCDNV